MWAQVLLLLRRDGAYGEQARKVPRMLVATRRVRQLSEAPHSLAMPIGPVANLGRAVKMPRRALQSDSHKLARIYSIVLEKISIVTRNRVKSAKHTLNAHIMRLLNLIITKCLSNYRTHLVIVCEQS